MLYTCFPDFLNMSLTASIVILVLIVLRPLLRKVPHSISVMLWSVALFRLLCPVSFSSDYALLKNADIANNRIRYLPTERIEDALRLSETKPVEVIAKTALQSSSGSLGRTDLAHILLILAAWGWIIGIAVFLILNAVSMFRLHRHCIGAVQIEKGVFLADHIATPFVLGIIRPRIYLPSTLTQAQCALILKHERTHIARLDPLWKLLAFLALMLHWFNPVVWLGFCLFVRDMETACDERVLSDLNADERADYAAALLQLSTGKRMLSVSPAFGEDSPKTRIKRILKYKKPITVVSVISAVLAVGLAVMLIANPKERLALAGELIPELPGGEYEYYGVSICYDPERDESYGDFSYGLTEAGEDTAWGIVYFLENLQIEAKPVSKSRSEDRDKSNTLSLSHTDGVSEVSIHFNHDFSRMWVDNHVKPSYTYAVYDRELVRELFTFLLTGHSEDTLLNAVFEAHRVACTDPYVYALYCPPMQQNEGSIKIGNLHASYVTDYLHAYETSWSQMLPVKDAPPSPESVEFVLRDDYRIQIWKDPRRAVIRDGEEETWFRTPVNAYSEAVELVTTYSLTQEEVAELLQSEASAAE